MALLPTIAARAVNRALEGISGKSVAHLCFGYAHIVHERPSGSSILPELEAVNVDVSSTEAAQPNLDLSILEQLPSKTFLVGVISLGDPELETPEIVEGRIRRALAVLPPERLWIAPDCGMKYRSREVAFGKLQSMARGAETVRRELAG